MNNLRLTHRYHSLDIWRGVACLFIVVYHSSLYAADMAEASGSNGGIYARTVFKLLAWMSVGVPMFFVISGYCVTAACDSLRARPRAVGQYFRRRFRRIFPPYWIFLAAAAIVYGLVYWAGFSLIYSNNSYGIRYGMPSPAALTGGQWLGNLSLIETWRSKLFGGQMGLFQMHAWTLCYEEQFYAVCGFVLFLTPRHFFRGLTTLTAIVAIIFVTTQANKNYAVAGFFFDGMWLLFAAGALVYFRFQYASVRNYRVLDVLMIAATVAVYAFSKSYPAKIPLMLKVAVPFAVLLIVLYQWDMPMISSRLLRPIAWCGTMCYSLYLVHEPIVQPISYLFSRLGRGPVATLMMTLPVTMTASLLAAWAFHMAVEAHFSTRYPSFLRFGVTEEIKSTSYLRRQGRMGDDGYAAAQVWTCARPTLELIRMYEHINASTYYNGPGI